MYWTFCLFGESGCYVNLYFSSFSTQVPVLLWFQGQFYNQSLCGIMMICLVNWGCWGSLWSPLVLPEEAGVPQAGVPSASMCHGNFPEREDKEGARCDRHSVLDILQLLRCLQRAEETLMARNFLWWIGLPVSCACPDVPGYGREVPGP